MPTALELFATLPDQTTYTAFIEAQHEAICDAYLTGVANRIAAELDAHASNRIVVPVACQHCKCELTLVEPLRAKGYTVVVDDDSSCITIKM